MRSVSRQRPVPGLWLAGAVSLVLLGGATKPAHALIPNDPGTRGQPGGWQADQWNFLAGTGVDAPRAWDNLIAAGRPGGRGVKIAVLDSGLAYENRGRYRRSPDVSRMRLVRGYDFCARTRFIQRLRPSPTFGYRCVATDRHPDDGNGHGTHVAGTIAEATNNGLGETGLAYGATIMPVKVTGRVVTLSGQVTQGGDDRAFARGIRYAVRHGAQIINISSGAQYADPVAQAPRMTAAVGYAVRHGVLVVASAGNDASSEPSYPAALPGVVSVGATTEHGCLAATSNRGPWVDLVAPGGYMDAALTGDPACRPQDPPGRSILQMTLTHRAARPFGMPSGYSGTSMAAPHVSATAALVIASGVLGPRPSPAELEARLKATARDLGAPGPDAVYGAGLVDAGAATARP